MPMNFSKTKASLFARCHPNNWNDGHHVTNTVVCSVMRDTQKDFLLRSLPLVTTDNW